MGKYNKRFEIGEVVPADVSIKKLAQESHLYVAGKITHSGWFSNWNLSRWRSLLEQGVINYAIPTEAYFAHIKKLENKGE